MSQIDAIIVGSAGIENFVVSRHLKSEKHERRELVILTHQHNYWLDNAVSDIGGGGLIASITLARQGLVPALVTKIGADLFGHLIQGVLDEEKIDQKYLVVDKKHATDTAIHLTANGKEQTNLSYQGSYISFSIKEFRLPVAAKMLYLATLPAEIKLLKALINWAKKHSIAVAIHPSNVDTLKIRNLVPVLAECDLIIVNRDELSLLLGGFFAPIEALAHAHAHNLRKVVLYDEDEGLHCLDDGLITMARPSKQTKPLEPSRAENVFAAAYVAAHLQGEPVARCLSLANAQAQASMSVVGVRAGILRKPLAKDLKTKQYVLQGENV